MLRGKRFIALICSLAMVLSMFTSLVVNAEGNEGIELEYLKDQTDDSQIVLVAKYVGDSVGGFTFNINLPQEAKVTDDDIKVTVASELAKDFGLTVAPNDTAKTLGVVCPGKKRNNYVKTTDNILATVVVPLASALSADFEITFNDAELALPSPIGLISMEDETIKTTSVTIPGPKAAPTSKRVPEGQNGIDFYYDEENSSPEKVVIIAKYVGDSVGGFTFNINLPKEAKVTDDDIKVTVASELAKDFGLTVAPNDTAKTLGVVCPGKKRNNYVKTTDNILATIEVPLATALTEDFEATMNDGELALESPIGLISTEEESMPLTSVVIPAPTVATPTPTAPTATEPSATTPVESTSTPVATADPRPVRPAIPTVAPTEAPTATIAVIPVGENGGIEWEYDAENSSPEKAVIIAKYVGDSVGGFSFNVNLPQEAKVTDGDIKVTVASELAKDFGLTIAPNDAAKTLGVVCPGKKRNNYVTTTGKVLATIEIPLSTPLTKDFNVTMNDGELALPSPVGLISYEDGTLVLTNTVIPAPKSADPTATPTGEPTPAATATVAEDVQNAVPEDTSKVKDMYLTVEVKANGQDLAYGTGYTAALAEDTTIGLLDENGNVVATYEAKAGETLPEYVYQYLIGGYTNVPMSKITKNLTWKLNDPAATVKTALNIDYNDGTSEKVEEKEPEIPSSTATPAPTPTATTTPGTPGGSNSDNTTTYTYTTGGGSGSKGMLSGSANIAGAASGTPSTGNIVTTFSDLGDAAWAATAITALAAKGAINGYDDGTFKPNQSITRAEFTKMLMGAYGMVIPDYAESEIVYSDVNENDWFYKYVYYGTRLGIVNGYDDGTFRPNNLVSRQEMAVIVYRMANVAHTELNPVNEAKTFDDAYLIGDWAAEAVTTLQQAGVINGTSDTTFEPTAGATRAHAAQIIYNVDLLR